jgi:hypothetical protein
MSSFKQSSRFAGSVVRSLSAPDGTRVAIVRDDTYQSALSATRKAIRSHIEGERQKEYAKKSHDQDS